MRERLRPSRIQLTTGQTLNIGMANGPAVWLPPAAPCARPPAPLQLAGERQPIAHSGDAHSYPAVVVQLAIEGANGFGVRVAVVRVDHAAVPEHVVNGHQAARAQ